MVALVVQTAGPFFRDGVDNPSGNFGGATVAGNAVIAVLATYQGSITSISDSTPTALTIDTQAVTDQQRVIIASRLNSPSVTGVTSVAAAGYWALWLFEVSGLLTAAALDTGVTATNGDVDGTPAANITAAGALAQAGNFVIAVFGFSGASGTEGVSNPAGYTTIASNDGAVHEPGGASYKITTGVSTPSASWTYASSPANWQAAIAAYKDTGGGGGGPSPTSIRSIFVMP